jgi:hypothetical protein
LPDETLYTIRDVATAMGVTPLAVRKWIRAQPPKLQSVRIGRRVYVTGTELERILRGEPVVP